jgi:hypothetical protein
MSCAIWVCEQLEASYFLGQFQEHGKRIAYLYTRAICVGAPTLTDLDEMAMSVTSKHTSGKLWCQLYYYVVYTKLISHLQKYQSVALEQHLTVSKSDPVSVPSSSQLLTSSAPKLPHQ